MGCLIDQLPTCEENIFMHDNLTFVLSISCFLYLFLTITIQSCLQYFLDCYFDMMVLQEFQVFEDDRGHFHKALICGKCLPGLSFTREASQFW